MFLGHLSPLTSCKFLTLILFPVLAVSIQLPQLFLTPFLTQSVLPKLSILFGAILKRTFAKQPLITLAANSNASDSLMRFIDVLLTYLPSYLFHDITHVSEGKETTQSTAAVNTVQLLRSDLSCRHGAHQPGCLCYIILNIHYTNCYQIVDMTLPTLCDLGDIISR